MKPGIPWSVKGIEPEVREAAKHAARRAGMTLGEWLNNVILEQEEQASGLRRPRTPTPHEKLSSHERYSELQAEAPHHEARPLPPAALKRDENTLRLHEIAQQLAELAQRERQSAAIQPSAPTPAPSEDDEVLSRILDRIEENERQTVEAFTAVNERLSVLGQQIAMVPRPRALERPEDVPGYSALEAAIRNVVEHIEVSERRTRDSLKSMQDRLGEMAERAVKPSNPDELVRAAPAFASLETRLSDLVNRMARSESLIHSGMPDAVRKELNQLGERIEGVRGATEKIVAQAESSALGVARSELRDIESRILGILKEAQSTIGSQSAAIADVGRLRAEVGGLGKRVDEVKVNAASQHDMHALRVALEQLSTRVAQGADLRPVAELDRRIGELSRKFEQTTAAARELPQFGELERRIAELDHRLGEVMRLQGDGKALAALENNIAAVNDRISRTEEQLLHLETMERAIRQLYESLEQNRSMSSQMAEEAANRAVERVLAAQGEAGPSPELRALEEGLRAVRESAASADQRNQDTLQAVHETLSQIVQKLAELESAPPVGEPAPATPEASSSPDPDTTALRTAETPNEVSFSSITAEQMQAGFEAAAFSAAAEKPATAAPPLSAGDDFIAAARRAAQAAASRPSALRAEYAASAPAQKQKQKRSFSLPFFGKSAKREEPATGATPYSPPGSPPPANENHARRKKLVLAGIVLLAAASAFAFNMLAKPRLFNQTSAVETPAGTAEERIIPDRLAGPGKLGLMDVPTDSRITGSLPARKTDASLSSIVAEPSAARAEMPPVEAGPLALREAAARGDAKAQFIIGSRYLDGDGMAQDLTKAAYWYQQAASRGLAPAQYRLATLFERGKGVPQDIATAQLWYERAAAGGNVKSMHNAAVLAAGTLVGTPNYDKAFRMFKSAAERGLHDSQFNLAVLYERGLGTKVDQAEAWFWYSLAAQQGDGDAAKRAETLAGSLPTDALSLRKAQINGWTPKPTDEAANVVAITDPAWQSPASTASPQPATLLSTDSATPEAATDVQPESSVAEAQRLLTRLGFNIGTADGQMGSRTANAIRLFQLQSGLKVTGELTPELLDAMRAKAG